MSGAPTIKTGLNTFEPLSWTVTPDTKIIGCNGVNRGIIYDGRTVAAWDLGIDAPRNGPAVVASGMGGLLEGDYVCAYRWVDADGIGSSLSPLTTASATTNTTFTWTLPGAPANTRLVTVELYRSVGDVSDSVYRVAALPIATTSFATDTILDEPLGNEPTATGGIVGNIASSGNSGGFPVFTTDAAHNLYVGAVVSIANHSVDAYTRVEHRITAVGSPTTFKTDATYVSNGTLGQWQLQNLFLSTGSDPATGYRFAPPPDFKSVPIYFQDRMWLGVDVVYDSGTCTFTATSKELAGTGTAWTSQMVGRFIYPKGDTKGYRIVRWVSATSMFIETAAQTSFTNGLYAIRPEPTAEDEFYFSEVNEPESMRLTNVVRVQRRTGDCDRWTAMKEAGPALYLFKERSIYKLTYMRQPLIDTNVSLFAARGCLNNRCTDLAQGNLYAMDKSGPFRLDGSGIDEEIGQPVSDLFRDGTIDFTQQKTFHVKSDPTEGVVRFHMAFVGDTALFGLAGPCRALCFNYRLNVWWQELYAWPLRGTVLLDSGDRLQRYAAGNDERIYLMAQGTTDGTTVPNGAAIGTIDEPNVNLLDFTVSATSPGDCNGASIAIISGVAKGQIRRLSLASGGQGTTSLTVDTAWTTSPVAGDVYVIGAISWSFRTGVMSLLVTGERSRQSLGVVFSPTTTPTKFDARVYYNHDTSPQTLYMTGSVGDGVSWEAGSPDAVYDMRVDRSALGVSTGFEQHDFGGHGDPKSQPERFLSIELRGYQAQSMVQLHGLEIDGVTGGDG